jgi:hypothetical protein
MDAQHQIPFAKLVEISADGLRRHGESAGEVVDPDPADRFRNR